MPSSVGRLLRNSGALCVPRGTWMSEALVSQGSPRFHVEHCFSGIMGAPRNRFHVEQLSFSVTGARLYAEILTLSNRLDAEPGNRGVPRET